METGELLGSTPRRQGASGPWCTLAPASRGSVARQYLASADFTKHSENLRVARQGLIQIQRAHKDAIRDGNEAAVTTLARVHGLQIGIVAEAWIRKVIADPNGFNDRERSYLRQARSRIDTWSMTVDLAFRRHFSVPLHLEIDQHTTNMVTATQFATISGLITSELAPVIEDRNKVAHAQWAWHLNSRETQFTRPAPMPINYSALLSRAKLIRAIGQIVTVLTLSGWTFQRDYDNLVAQVRSAQAGLDGSYYEEFKRRLIERAKKGQAD